LERSTLREDSVASARLTRAIPLDDGGLGVPEIVAHASQLTGAAIHRQDATVLIEEDDGIWKRLKRRLERRFRAQNLSQV
jgi:hypothetical protein